MQGTHQSPGTRLRKPLRLYQELDSHRANQVCQSLSSPGTFHTSRSLWRATIEEGPMQALNKVSYARNGIQRGQWWNVDCFLVIALWHLIVGFESRIETTVRLMECCRFRHNPSKSVYNLGLALISIES